MPPLNEEALSVGSVPSFFMRLIGLNWSLRDGRSETGRGFLDPKNTDGLAARDTDGPLNKGWGLATAADPPPGVNELAAGLGLNSIALTLNFEDPIACDLLGLLTPDRSPAGPVGGVRPSGIGKGVGTVPIAALPFRCCRLSARRWLSMPVPGRPG